MEQQTIQQQIALFRSVGITGITQELAQAIESRWNDIPEEIRESIDMAATVLMDIGSGITDYEEGTWEATSDVVFSFDVEIFNIDKMFTNVLLGIQAINKGEFQITGVEESSEIIDENDGTAKQTIEFCYNGAPYCYTGDICGDWFDGGFLVWFNQILMKEGSAKRLYVTFDGYQELIVFYNTEEWAKEFTEKTGMEFGAERG